MAWSLDARTRWGLQVVITLRNNQQIHLKKPNKLCFFGLFEAADFTSWCHMKMLKKLGFFCWEPVGTVVSLIHSHYNMLSTQLFLSTPLSHQPCLAWLKRTTVLTRCGSSRCVWWHHSCTPKNVDRDLANEVVLVQLQTLAWFIYNVSLIPTSTWPFFIKDFLFGFSKYRFSITPDDCHWILRLLVVRYVL